MNCKVYVGDYGEYASGRLTGFWTDLSDYENKDEFVRCVSEKMSRAAQKHIKDVELMIQDFDGDFSGLISESFIEPLIFDLLADDEDGEKVLEFIQEIDSIDYHKRDYDDYKADVMDLFCCELLDNEYGGRSYEENILDTFVEYAFSPFDSLPDEVIGWIDVERWWADYRHDFNVTKNYVFYMR